MLIMLKHQQFEDRRSDKIKPRGSKRQCLDKHDNKENNGLDENKSEIKDAKYVLLPFIPLFFFKRC